MSDSDAPSFDPSALLLGGDVPGAFMELAVDLADAASTVVMRHFRRDVLVEHKADASPVTIADREAEAEMRKLIEARFPDHGIFGEEHGRHATDAEYVWVLDPIDGTKSFITGKPLFGTLIALVENGTPIIGVIDMPALGERFVGARGRPSTHDGVPITTRACAGLDRAWLYATSPYMFEGDRLDDFDRLRRSVLTPMFGADCYAYGLLAAGLVDVVCESDMQPYDYMAMIPVIEGAGGRVTDWNGNTLGLDGDGTVLATGDPALHEPALALLNG